MIQQATSNQQQTNTKRSQRPIGQHGNIGTSAHAHRHQHKYSQSQASFLRRCEDPHLRSGGGGQAAESLEPGWAVRGCSLAGALGGAASAAGSCRPAAVPCGDGRGGAARVRRWLWESRRGRGTKGEGDWESWRVPGPGGLAAAAAMAECPS